MIHLFKIFRDWDALKLAAVVFIFILSALVEGFGITTILPLLASNFGSKEIRDSDLSLIGFDNWSFNTETLIGILIIAIFLKAILLFFAHVFLAVVAAKITSSKRIKAFRIVKSYTKKSFFLAVPGEILSILNEHIRAASQAFVSFAYAISYCFITIVYAIFALSLSGDTFFYVILFGGIVGVGMHWLNGIAKRISASNVIESVSFLDSWTSFYQSWYYFKATGLFGLFEHPTNRKVERLRVLEVKFGALTGLLVSLREPIFVVLLVFILSLATNDKNNWMLDIGGIFLLYRAYSAAMNAAQRFQKCSQKYASVTLVHEKVFLAYDHVDRLPEGILAPSECSVDSITLRGVRAAKFTNQDHYPTIDVDLSKGDILAISGASGSGKTTVLNVFLGLEPLEVGDYQFFGNNVSKNFCESLRSQIGFVPQDPCILEGRLIDNFVTDPRLADDVEFRLNKVYPLVASLGLTHFGQSAEISIDAFLDQDMESFNLSGGELQRICIAREVLKEPFLLVLDEPTSALDSKNTSLVIALLKQIRPTTIIVFASHDDALLGISTINLVLE